MVSRAGAVSSRAICSRAKAGRPRFAYFPFGGGGRQCIGESFAWMEAILALATIAQRWRVELVPGPADRVAAEDHASAEKRNPGKSRSNEPENDLAHRPASFGFKGRQISISMHAVDSKVGFQSFHGNTATVRHLREGLRSGHFPQALILAGPRGRASTRLR